MDSFTATPKHPKMLQTMLLGLVPVGSLDRSPSEGLELPALANQLLSWRCAYFGFLVIKKRRLKSVSHLEGAELAG